MATWPKAKGRSAFGIAVTDRMRANSNGHALLAPSMDFSNVSSALRFENVET